MVLYPPGYRTIPAGQVGRHESGMTLDPELTGPGRTILDRLERVTKAGGASQVQTIDNHGIVDQR